MAVRTLAIARKRSSAIRRFQTPAYQVLPLPVFQELVSFLKRAPVELIDPFIDGALIREIDTRRHHGVTYRLCHSEMVWICDFFLELRLPTVDRRLGLAYPALL